MDEVTGVLVSTNFGYSNLREQERLTSKYVLSTLARKNVPLDISAILLPYLIPEEQITLIRRPFSDSNWAQLRTARTPLWLQTRQRLKQAVIPNYDFTSPVYVYNIIDGDALKDAKLNAVRNKAIQENSRKVQGRNDQRLVRSLDKSFSTTAENEVIIYYSHTPYDKPELERLLNIYVEDTATKQRILDEVDKNKSAAERP